MDPEIVATIQKAVELIRAKEATQAQALLLPLLERYPDTAEAWYLLGFTYADPRKKMQSFLQVMRIDPNNEAARKQIIRLTSSPPPLMSPEPDAPPTKLETPPEPVPVASVQSGLVADIQPAPAANIEPPPTANPQPKMPKQPLPRRVIWAINGTGIALGLLVVYLGIGFIINQGIVTTFASRNCTQVMQFAFLAKSHPKFLFSSLFSAYRPLEECQARLTVDQAINAKEWETAYKTMLGYLQAFPDGAFAPEMQNQAGDILLAWTESLIAQDNYMAAIQELFNFQGRFPKSPKAPQVWRALYDDYLRLIRVSLEKKDYEGAERYLNLVIGSKNAAPDQVQQAKQLLAQLNTIWKKP